MTKLCNVTDETAPLTWIHKDETAPLKDHSVLSFALNNFDWASPSHFVTLTNDVPELTPPV